MDPSTGHHGGPIATLEHDPARPAPRPTAREWCLRTVQWVGPRRIIGGIAVATGVAIGGWWLLHAPPPAVERSLPVATRAEPVTTALAVVPTSAAPAPTFVVVHVAGAVQRPGLVTLPVTARVADAIDAAGGAAAQADLDALNLAANLVDGTRVYVPRHGEIVAAPVVGPSAQGGDAPSGPIDLNMATAAQLEDLPGIGPATAAAIVAHREANGPFRTVDDLLDVRGIGPAKLEQFRALVSA